MYGMYPYPYNYGNNDGFHTIMEIMMVLVQDGSGQSSSLL